MKLTLAVVVILTYIATTNAFLNPAALAMAGGGGGGGGFKQALLMNALMNNQNGGGGAPAGGQNPLMKMMMMKMIIAQLGENPLAAYSLINNLQIDPIQLLMMSGGENMKALMPILMQHHMQKQMQSQMMPPGAAQPGQMTPM